MNYVSDRVFDGTRPLSAVAVQQLKRNLKMGFSELARERQKLSEKNDAPVVEPKADKPVDPAGQVVVDLSDPKKITSKPAVAGPEVAPVVADVKILEPAPAPAVEPAPVAPAAPAPVAGGPR